MARTLRFFLLISPLLMATGCGGGGSGGGGAAVSPPLNPNPPSAPTPPASASFSDATSGSQISYVVGISSPNPLGLEDDTSFGGAAAGDCDADGDIDLFITYGDSDRTGRGGGPNRLYLNQLIGGSGTPLQFEDNAVAAGVAYTRESVPGSGVYDQNERHSGPAFADLDGDRDLDLVVGALFGDATKVYRNNGDCTFEDVTEGSGLESLQAAQTIAFAFGDYDLDGDLDAFLTHWGSEDLYTTGEASEHLFRNDSTIDTIRFINVSDTSGITALHQANRVYSTQSDTADWSLTATFARIDNDLWPDITVTGDYGTAQLFLDNPASPGMFVDATNLAVHSVQFAMGSALGDMDFDLDLDWFVTSIDGNPTPNLRPTGNHLYRNPGTDFSGDGYEDVSEAAGISDGRWGWGACFVDIDNDMDLDIFHTNGWHLEFTGEFYTFDESRAFIGDGTGVFEDQAEDLGINNTDNGRGVICADFDNDGDVDLLELTNEAPVSSRFWRNDVAAGSNNFLRVQLVGLPPNTEASGARVFAEVGGVTMMREISIGSNNYISQNPTVQLFGLGSASSVDTLTVEWPAIAQGTPPIPEQPPQWVRTNVPAGNPATTTLIICHPDLVSPPANCLAPD